MRFLAERLEPRQLLATVTWEQDLITVVGTEFDDVIVAEIAAGELTFSGSDVRIPLSEQLRLDVKLLGGNDTFTNNTSLRSTVDGGDGDDVLLGGDGQDTLYGRSGADRLQGRGGDDRLNGGGEAGDRVMGGAGLDYVIGVTMNYSKVSKVLTIQGTSAGEEVRIFHDGEYLWVDGAQPYPWPSADVTKVVVHLKDGDDIFRNESTTVAEVWGEGGNDDLSGLDKNFLDGGAGENTIEGTNRLNRIGWQGGKLMLQGTEADDTLILRRSGDEVYLLGFEIRWPAPSSVVLEGLAGDDRLINGTHTSVSFIGGDGDDLIVGGYKRSQLTGGAGDDFIVGSREADRIAGNAGDDRLYGGSGGDAYVFESAEGYEHDAIYDNDLTDVSNADTLDFGLVASNLTVEFDGNRPIISNIERELRVHGAVVERIVGGAGNDILYSHPATAFVEGNAGDDQIIGNSRGQELRGGDGNDTILAGEGDNVIDAGFGSNTVIGGSGNDVVRAKSGNDMIVAGNGDNVIDAGDGDNTIVSGVGNDSIQSGMGMDSITDGGGNDTIDSGGGSDRLIATGTGSDYLAGGWGDDYIDAGDGDNTILGLDGHDIIYGGNGIDLIHAGSGNDSVFGLAGNDLIRGDSGDDTLDGGEGDDEIWGFRHPIYSRDVLLNPPETFANILIGGPGDDTLEANSSADRLFYDSREDDGD